MIIARKFKFQIDKDIIVIGRYQKPKNKMLS